MSFSGTWYHGDNQAQGEVAHNYQQPNQYNHYEPPPPPPYEQHNYQQQNYQPQDYQQQNYQQQGYQQQSYPQHDYKQANHHQQEYQAQSHDRSTYQTSNFHGTPQYVGQQQYDSRPYQQGPPVQQQYIPAHAAYVPPDAVQTFSGTSAHYQYSDLHGKRKALLIGCNYPGGSSPLKGCINDVHNVKDFLIQGYRFQPQNMWIMTDDLTDPRSIPTRANILTGMKWLVQNAAPGDDLFLHFSGHGGPIKDVDGDEDDGYDEAIFPTDSEKIQNGPGYIVDDLIHDICVKTLPQGCRLTAIFDCCHSGSIMDLPYMYSAKGVLKEPSLLKDTGMGLMGIGAAYVQQDLGSMVVGTAGLLKRYAKAASGHNKKVKAAKASAADVICFSGCKDHQTSMDANISSQSQGAMSHAFKASLMKYGGNLTYIQLLQSIRQVLMDGGYEQKPQLSACHPIDLDLLFTL